MTNLEKLTTNFVKKLKQSKEYKELEKDLLPNEHITFDFNFSKFFVYMNWGIGPDNAIHMGDFEE